jgi:hypothetical protein
MRFPWANLALLVLVVLQLVTGFAGLLGASDPFRVFFWIHAVGAYAIVVVLFAKAMIIADVLRRRPGLGSERFLLVFMIGLLVAVLATGLIWITSGPYVLAGYSLINLHAFLAVALAMLLTMHVLDRRWIVRVPTSHDRRAFLRFAGIAVVGVALWQIERPLQRLLDLPGARRRVTGSYERGSFSTDFPTVSWLNDNPNPIDGASWRLAVEGAVGRPLDLRYADLERMGGRRASRCSTAPGVGSRTSAGRASRSRRCSTRPALRTARTAFRSSPSPATAADSRSRMRATCCWRPTWRGLRSRTATAFPPGLSFPKAADSNG